MRDWQIVGIIIIAVAIFGVYLISLMSARIETRTKECEQIGGTYVYGSDISLCLDKKVVLFHK